VVAEDLRSEAARAGGDVEAGQSAILGAALVVLGVADAERGLPVLDEFPVDLAIDRLACRRDGRPVVIETTLRLRVRADVAGEGAGGAGKERAVELRLVQQNAGRRLQLALVVVVGACQPLERAVSGGGQVQLMAVPGEVLPVVGGFTRQDARARAADEVRYVEGGYPRRVARQDGDIVIFGAA